VVPFDEDRFLDPTRTVMANDSAGRAGDPRERDAVASPLAGEGLGGRQGFGPHTYRGPVRVAANLAKPRRTGSLAAASAPETSPRRTSRPAAWQSPAAWAATASS
jgi:hypothetical protein